MNNEKIQKEREKYQKIVDDLNNSSDECLAAISELAFIDSCGELDRLKEGLIRLRDTTSCTQIQYHIIDELLSPNTATQPTAPHAQPKREAS